MTQRDGEVVAGHRSGRLAIAALAVAVAASGGTGVAVALGRTPVRIAPVVAAEPPPVRPIVLPETARRISKPKPPPVPVRTVAPVATRKRVVKKAPACPATPAVPTYRATAAQGIGHSVHVYDSPNGRVTRELSNPWDGEPLALLIVERQGDWLNAKLPIRPNGVTGWVHASEVGLYTVPTRILIELCHRRLTVYDQGRPVFQKRVAIGTAKTPTPIGRFYVNYEYQPERGNCCGPWIISVAAFSEVLQEFNGGIGQIAIHGWRDASVMGKRASHGCIRMTHGDVTKVAMLIQPGTPVTIVP